MYERGENLQGLRRQEQFRQATLLAVSEDEILSIVYEGLTVAYPLVAEWGFTLSAPVAVVVADEEDLVLFQNKNPVEVIPISNPPGSVTRYLKCAEYNVRTFKYSAGRYAKENLQQIQEFSNHVVTDISAQTLFVILHVGFVQKPEMYAGILYLNSTLKKLKQGKHMAALFSRERFIRFLIENEDLLMQEVTTGCSGNLDQNEKVLNAILCVLENYWKRMFSTEAKERILPCFHRVAEKMKKLWLPVASAETYVTAFVKAAYEITDVLQCVPRTEVPPELEQNLDQMILFDDLAYYVPINYLDKICERLSNGEGTAFIKGQLCEAGLLEREGRGRTYYTKMTEILIGNHVVRRRYAKIRREKMDQAGKETWLEVMQMKGEKNNDADKTRQFNDILALY